MTAADVNGQSAVDSTIVNRSCVRAFVDTEVSDLVIREILDVARHAPSGSNTQPWKVYITKGQKQKQIINQVCAADTAVKNNTVKTDQYLVPYDYYPLQWISPYKERRQQNGWGLYSLLGIGKRDLNAIHIQHQENFRFFGAPVGLFFTIDRAMSQGSFLDYGMFLQNIMLAAHARGLGTCPQAAWNKYWTVVMPLLKAGSNEMLVCAMAMGYADSSAVINSMNTPRENTDSFAVWL